MPLLLPDDTIDSARSIPPLTGERPPGDVLSGLVIYLNLIELLSFSFRRASRLNFWTLGEEFLGMLSASGLLSKVCVALELLALRCTRFLNKTLCSSAAVVFDSSMGVTAADEKQLEGYSLGMNCLRVFLPLFLNSSSFWFSRISRML